MHLLNVSGSARVAHHQLDVAVALAPARVAAAVLAVLGVRVVEGQLARDRGAAASAHGPGRRAPGFAGRRRGRGSCPQSESVPSPFSTRSSSRDCCGQSMCEAVVTSQKPPSARPLPRRRRRPSAGRPDAVAVLVAGDVARRPSGGAATGSLTVSSGRRSPAGRRSAGESSAEVRRRRARRVGAALSPGGNGLAALVHRLAACGGRTRASARPPRRPRRSRSSSHAELRLVEVAAVAAGARRPSRARRTAAAGRGVERVVALAAARGSACREAVAGRRAPA